MFRVLLEFFEPEESVAEQRRKLATKWTLRQHLGFGCALVVLLAIVRITNGYNPKDSVLLWMVPVIAGSGAAVLFFAWSLPLQEGLGSLFERILRGRAYFTERWISRVGGRSSLQIKYRQLRAYYWAIEGTTPILVLLQKEAPIRLMQNYDLIGLPSTELKGKVDEIMKKKGVPELPFEERGIHLQPVSSLWRWQIAMHLGIAAILFFVGLGCLVSMKVNGGEPSLWLLSLPFVYLLPVLAVSRALEWRKVG